MQVLVYGAGAVGSLLAAYLAEARPPDGERPAVTLLGRRPHVAKASAGRGRKSF